MTYDPDRIKYIIAEALRFKAENEYWKDVAISRVTGIPRETLYSWLTGSRTPRYTSANLEALERFLQERGYAE